MQVKKHSSFCVLCADSAQSPWGPVGWLRFGLYLITKCPHQAVRLLLTNKQIHMYVTIFNSVWGAHNQYPHTTLGLWVWSQSVHQKCFSGKIICLAECFFSWDALSNRGCWHVCNQPQLCLIRCSSHREDRTFHLCGKLEVMQCPTSALQTFAGGLRLNLWVTQPAILGG
jgi:hypothetical protein